MAVLVKPLSITEINNAKSKGKDYSLSDDQGLFLLVAQTNPFITPRN